MVTSPKNPARRRKTWAPSRVLVLYKKTEYAKVQENQDARMLDLIAQGHESVARMEPSHRQHEETLTAIRKELSVRGIEHRFVPREAMPDELRTGDWDLLATVGGDGTVIDGSHYVSPGVPILGINSALLSSHGHFCLANVGNLGSVLDAMLAGKLKPLSLMRLQVTLDGKLLPERVLNEVRIKHKVDGETARYILHVNGRQSSQRGDALFFGTPSGSTGWMHSYGWMLKAYGFRNLPITSRRFLYLAQGKIVHTLDDTHMLTGTLRKSDKVQVVSTMSEGLLQLDGRHVSYEFPRGSELTVAPCDTDVQVFANPSVNENYLLV